VSREVVLRKCLDRGLIDQSYYEDRRRVWIDEAKGRRRGSTPGPCYYPTRAAYLGDTYLNLVFGKYYQKQFSKGQLAEYLGVKVDHIAGLEARFLGRGSFE
jgi:Zn-dependent peptidase ImmA (M78 family)